PLPLRSPRRAGRGGRRIAVPPVRGHRAPSPPGVPGVRPHGRVPRPEARELDGRDRPRARFHRRGPHPGGVRTVRRPCRGRRGSGRDRAAMMEGVQDLPLLPAAAFLYVGTRCRAGATYLVGRRARRVARRGRVAAFLESPGVTRASELINRWGAPVVALSFLTVGFQTAANAAAGLTGMPAKRYLPALAIGGLAWALIYAPGGLGAV